MNNPAVILSGFADEAANQKQLVQQFSAFAAIGLQYYTIRFVDVGTGIKNVMALEKSEVKQIQEMQREYGLKVASLGSPIGKVKLLDQDDGTNNRFVPFKTYLAKEVRKACDLANELGTRLIRGFSFYHPRGTDPKPYVSQVVDQLGQIADMCAKHEIVFGLEIEANLVGQTGDILADIYKSVNRDNLVLIFDAANIVCQGYQADEVWRQYQKMKPGLGWLHIKDYRHPRPVKNVGHVDEDALKHFVPCDIGHSGHEALLRDLRDYIPKMEKRLKKFGIPGVILDLEPHVKGGGQFGGFSGPDGFGVALRSLCRTLGYVGIDYHLRDFQDIVDARGF